MSDEIADIRRELRQKSIISENDAYAVLADNHSSHLSGLIITRDIKWQSHMLGLFQTKQLRYQMSSNQLAEDSPGNPTYGLGYTFDAKAIPEIVALLEKEFGPPTLDTKEYRSRKSLLLNLKRITAPVADDGVAKERAIAWLLGGVNKPDLAGKEIYDIPALPGFALNVVYAPALRDGRPQLIDFRLERRAPA
ncbi:MAG: hypothetical protein AB7G06_03455 [Bdellovibrionales bacterium]